MVERKTLARPYAKAVFSIAKDSCLFSEWSELLQMLAIIVADNSVKKLIKNQTISARGKAKFIVDVVGNKIQTSGINLVTILAQYARLDLLPEISEMFKDFQQEEEGGVTVTVKVAHKLLDQAERKLQTALNKKFNKDVEINFMEDKQLLAGVSVKAKDRVIDCSLYGQLEELRKVLEG
jgi:F-type H+-transporting ATPase subunit delta